VNDLGFCPPIDIVEQENSLLEENVHLVVFLVVAATWLFEDIEVEHLAEITDVDLVGFNRLLGYFLRKEVSVGGHESID
jgi:hypothetical protein